MKNLYGAGNLAEAHMLQDLLSQQGIEVIVQGEYLQGGLGDLPASGLVRLLVDDGEYARAKEFLDEWLASQSQHEPEFPRDKHPRKSGIGAVGGGLAGLLLGFGISYVYYMVPVTSDVVDRNNDGVPEETWNFASDGIARSVELDRNSDGKIDSIVEYTRSGENRAAFDDNDFNGTYETSYKYSDNNSFRSESDTDNDGRVDLIGTTKNGVFVYEEWVSSESGRVFRKDYYQNSQLSKSEVDLNSDGVFETVRIYDKRGEIVPSGMANE
jgi:hypothetical protein